MGDPSLGPPVVMPDSLAVLRAYLVADPGTAALVDDRVSTELPNEPTWPCIRLTLINAFPSYAIRLDRVFIQADCFDPSQQLAHEVARTARAALFACGGHVASGAVLSGAQNLSLRPIPDDSYTPPVHRFVVAGYVFVRPNP
jgi:Protein of unknown function (DUF3168)